MFLNVDLDLKSSHSIQLLLAALQAEMLVLNESLELTSLELKNSKDNLNDCVLEIASIIEGLESGAREEWDRCYSKQLNIGFRQSHNQQENLSISSIAVASIAALGCEVAFTIYTN